MSFSFYLTSDRPLHFHEVLEGFCQNDLACEEGQISMEDPWPKGKFFHFYLPHISTRTVEVGYEDEVFQVRILTLSSREDYQLALHFTERAALSLGCQIESEEGEVFPVEEIAIKYGRDWVEEMSEQGPRLIAQMLHQYRESPLTIPGPRRDFIIGPRLLAELEDGPDESFPRRMFEAMRKTFYIGISENIYEANIIAMISGGKEEEREVTFSVWGPETRYVFPLVERLALIQADEQKMAFMIPYEKVPDLVGNRCQYLDEAQLIIEPLALSEWESLLKKARPYAIDVPTFDD